MNTVKLTIFFDGDCPLCKREVDFLQSKNKEGSLKFIDINRSDFSLDYGYGITYKQAMERIHSVKVMVQSLRILRYFKKLIDWIRFDLCSKKNTNCL